MKFKSNLPSPIRKSIKEPTTIVDDKYILNAILNGISPLPLYCHSEIAIKFKIIPKKVKLKSLKSGIFNFIIERKTSIKFPSLSIYVPKPANIEAKMINIIN